MTHTLTVEVSHIPKLNRGNEYMPKKTIPCNHGPNEDECEICDAYDCGYIAACRSGGMLVSTDWLDALAERWNRRIKQLEKRYGGNAGLHNKGMIEAHKADLKELRANIKSASNK